MSSEKEEFLSKKSKRNKNNEILNELTNANKLFVKNDFNSCINTLKSIIKKSPKNSKAYFMLGLVFEEMKDDIKAYNFYLISSQLMKTNWALWNKLYELSTKLNLFYDKLYYIQMLQKNYNKRDLVLEKLELYRILKMKYKILETKIEMFYFDIFSVIRNETKHKARTAQCCILLFKFYKQYPNRCGIDFLINIFRLQYETGYFFGTKNFIEKYLLEKDIDLPNDIRIIYLICCLMNNDTTFNKDKEKVRDKDYNDKDIEGFKDNGKEKENEKEKDKYKEDKDTPYFTEYLDLSEFSEKVFNSNVSIFNDLKNKNSSFDIYTENDNLEFYKKELSKTLLLDSFFDTKNPYKKYSDLDIFINDKSFWDSFNEIEYIKGLLEVLKDMKNEIYYFKILKILESRVPLMNEFTFHNLGDFYFEKSEFDLSLFYYQKTLDVNPDNNFVKSKLYEIYIKIGNYDLAQKFRTISSLVNFVEDVENEDKFKLMSTRNKCNENRELYLKTRNLFKEDIEEYFEKVKPLVDDFLENRFIFTKLKRYKLMDADSKLCTEKVLIDYNRLDKIVHNKVNNLVDESNNNKIDKFNKNDIRLLSLHGLNTDEWSAVLLEYIISNIVKKNLKKASFFLKKCLECDLFKKEKDIYSQFVFLSIKHAIFYNDLNLLSNCFKKCFLVYKDYSWANLFFYLLHFFPNYILKNSYGNLVRNIRRTYKRNCVHINKYKNNKYKNDKNDNKDKNNKYNDKDKDKNDKYYNNNNKYNNDKDHQSLYKSLDLNILLNTFFMKNIMKKSYKTINNIILNESFRDKMIYNIILIITYKSRNNENKNEMLKKGINGLKGLLKLCSNEEYYNLSYNIGIAYNMLGYIGFAEKHYTEALSSKNIELKRLARLSLIIIYKKANNLTMLRKVFIDDDF